MDIEFNNLKELKNNNTFVTKDDIWNYLKQTKWSLATNLTLYDIVNDIMNINENEIQPYIIRSDKNDKS